MPRVIVPQIGNHRPQHAVGTQSLPTVDVFDSVGIHAVPVGPQCARTPRQVLEIIADEMDAHPRSLFQIVRHARASTDEASDRRGGQQGPSHRRSHRPRSGSSRDAHAGSDSFRQAHASKQSSDRFRGNGASGASSSGDGSLPASVQKGVAQRFCAGRLFRLWRRDGLQIVT